MADNYISKVKRIYVEDKIFKDPEAGREVNYARLCLQITALDEFVCACYNLKSLVLYKKGGEGENS